GALAVPVLSEPRHLDRFEELLVARLGIVAELRQLGHVAVQVGEANRQRVHVRELFAERDADVFCVTPRHHFGISTTTSPRTTAWQPRREWIVRPSAGSSRSSSSSAVSVRFSSPSFSITCHVAHAHEPPQLCSSSMPCASAMSSSEPGLPWSASGYFSSSTSTVLFSGRNVTLYVPITALREFRSRGASPARP